MQMVDNGSTRVTATSSQFGGEAEVGTTPRPVRTCGVCGGPIEVVDGLPWARFRHSDWSVTSTAPWSLIVCKRCGIASPDNRGVDLVAQYANRAYVDRETPVHHVRPPGESALIPAPQHQLDVLRPYLSDRPAILDVGCFDGRLLRAFRERYPAARLVGCDVGEELRKFFPPCEGIAFFAGDAAWDAGPFDLVVFSQSLQYIEGLNVVLQRVAANLSPEGRLFIQVPDLERRPISIVLGDLHHHFTRTSLANLVRLNGFDATVIEPTGFARDLVVVAVKDAAADLELSPEGGRRVLAALRAVDTIAQRVIDLMAAGGGNVFGTTIDAAFVAHILGDKLADFIDEAPRPEGITFLNRSVRYPRELRQDERTFVPVGVDATAVVTRLRQAYRGEFLPV
jgi:SAM-dependent methyltransferase